MLKNRRVVKRRREIVDFIDTTEELSTETVIRIVTQAFQAEGFRKRTIDDYTKLFHYFMRELNIEKVEIITAKHVQMYINKLLSRELAPATINIRISALKSVFKRLHEQGYIKSNPAVDFVKLRTDEAPIFTLNNNQIKRLFRVVDKTTYAGYRDYCAMLLMLHCGLRVNEVNQLEANDLDFDNLTIMLSGAKNKNRKTRAVPMTKKIAEELRMLIDESREYFEGTTNVFLTQDGNSIDNDLLRKRMYRYGQLAGLSKECRPSPHSLRHTFATNFLRNGGSVNALMRIMGHADITTTMRYVRLNDEAVKEQYEKVAAKNDYGV
ncbi:MULTISPECIES: tyrosine-type recombinase/integrase [Bacillus]|uniref:Tyrosine-type recombinase/integrase n=2 Tax=Bacillus cereus group TaxID=86661 RepID=A0AAW7NQM4_BACCE|nr:MULTISPECIES: tyrosine-type recombinase/integrase [Bacillus]EEM57167.1 Site-specific recombinase, phage integrase [Bacillus thuringiensis serovar monterrey BGSC 4AJ1]EEM81030.1 Site-specific recombinase, phage integrase [Bacillus thuringiensis serovar huazhongensis BGSC 4BD1]KXH86451.1 integrase [Bacillus sp. JH7]MDA1566971.1 tyrosine-type recombinase/integrase [Bacillus cereus]MDA2307931.1 tyrosine-type recombinase/integrase [Bacillus cereus]